MDTFQDLKGKFESVVSKQGYVLEADYVTLCGSVEDISVINKVAHWLLSSGIKLRKAIGPQYHQELLRKVRNPDVKDVVDTKHRTHKNTNKFQQSKKKTEHPETTTSEKREIAEHGGRCSDKGASFHLNKVIKELKDKETEDEFMPAWKKFKPEDTGKHPFNKYLNAQIITTAGTQTFEILQPGQVKAVTAPEYLGGMPIRVDLPFSSKAADISSRQSVIAFISKMRSGEEIDADGLARSQHIEPITAEQEMNKLVEEGALIKEGKWYKPTEEFLQLFFTATGVFKKYPSMGKLLSTFGIDAATWDIPYNAEAVRNYILDISSKYGDKVYVDPVTFPQFANVNFGNLANAEEAVANIDDVDLLRNLQMAIEGGNYTTEPQEGAELTPWEKQSSSVEREIDFGTNEAPAMELAHTAASIQNTMVTISFANGTIFVAPVADTPAKKAAGLEVFESLKPEEGLYFPFEKHDSVTFHMGKVKFPIDIIFLMETPHGMEVNKVVSDAQPGTMEYWTSRNTKAVLELSGGACKNKNINVGSLCRVVDNSKRIRVCVA